VQTGHGKTGAVYLKAAREPLLWMIGWRGWVHGALFTPKCFWLLKASLMKISLRSLAIASKSGIEDDREVPAVCIAFIRRLERRSCLNS